MSDDISLNYAFCLITVSSARAKSAGFRGYYDLPIKLGALGSKRGHCITRELG